MLKSTTASLDGDWVPRMARGEISIIEITWIKIRRLPKSTLFRVWLLSSTERR